LTTSNLATVKIVTAPETDRARRDSTRSPRQDCNDGKRVHGQADLDRCERSAPLRQIMPGTAMPMNPRPISTNTARV
jgi:hypothetical protein